MSDIMMASLSFSVMEGSPTGTVELTEGQNTTMADYYVSTVTDAELGIISPLVIELGSDEQPLRLVQVEESQGIKLMYDTNRDVFMVLAKDQDLAQSILNDFRN